MWPSNSNLRAIAKCAPPQTYTEIEAFLSLVGHYWQFIKGFVHIAQPLNGLLSGEGTSRKLEKVSLPEDALKAFGALKQACMNTPVLALADYTKEFLLETSASKEGLGQYFPRNRQMGDITQSPIVVKPLWLMKKLPLHQTGVPGVKMGSHGTFQGILAIPTLFSEN